MRFEYRKWGTGIYEVIWLHDYNPIAKMFYRKSMGMVKKVGTKWIVEKNPSMKAATRKKLSEMMVNAA